MRNLLLAATSLAVLAAPGGLRAQETAANPMGVPAGVPAAASPADPANPMPMPLPSPLPSAQPQVQAQMPPGMQAVSPQMPQGYYAVAPQQVYVPQTYVPVQGYVAPQGYVAAPVAVAPNYPAATYAPPGYEPARPPPPPSSADASLQAAISSILPLTEPMTRTVRRGYDGEQHVRSEPANGVSPHAGHRLVRLSLKPGERTPVVNLAAGNVSAITFADQTGAPWPVRSATPGDPRLYAVVKGPEDPDNNVVVLSPLSQYGAANMIVTLKGLPVPIILQLQTGKSAGIDGQLDIGVTGRGPLAKYDITVGSGLPTVNDPTMDDFADGIPPKGARVLNTKTADVEAWQYKDMVYVRTPLSVQSPAWVGISKGISNYYVYSFKNPRILVVERDGLQSLVTLTH